MTFMNVTLSRDYAVLSLLLGFAMIAVVAGAWAFQLAGYVPCKLCLQQREPYYLGAPLVLVGALSAVLAGPACVSRGLAFIGGLLMVYGGVLAVFHTGVEWGFWPGPTDCGAVGGHVTTDADALFSSELDRTVAPACDQAAGRFLGLSFAGWNVVASAALAYGAFWLAIRREPV